MTISIPGGVGVLIDLGITMQRNDQVNNAEVLHNFDYDSSADDVPGSVLAMRVIELDVEIGEVACLGLQG